MKYILDLNKLNCQTIFEKTINASYKINFFEDLRRVFREEINLILNEIGLKILPTINFEYSGKLLTTNSFELEPIKSKYGDNEYLDLKFCSGCGTSGISSINYQHRAYINLTSLYTFKVNHDFSIGNFIFFVENADYEIEIIKSDKIKCVGYSFEISKRKRKSFFCLFGVRFSEDALKPIFEKYDNEADKIDLDEVRFGYSKYPVLFASRRTGKIYTCECFREYINWERDFWCNCNLYNSDDIKLKIEEISYQKGICHKCTGETPKIQYGSSMYYTGFLQKYLPYFNLEYNKRFRGRIEELPFDKKELENELRVKFGYPKIGEKWISETILYQIVKELFAEREIIFHYRGKELEGLEIDIFIPSLKLGFEYQGEQHFKAIEHWGGVEGLNKRIENDKKKKNLCGLNKYHLIEVFYHEGLSNSSILSKIPKTILEYGSI